MIEVMHGTLSDLHSLGVSTWLFYLAPMHPGIVTVSAPVGAFIDDEGRSSVASDVLTVTVPSNPNLCLFLSRKRLVNELLVEVRIVCESVINPCIQDLSISNATVSSITRDESTNILFLSLTTTLVDTIIRVDFTTSFKSIYHVTSEELVIEYTSSYSLPVSPSIVSSSCSMSSEAKLVSSVVVYEVILVCVGIVSSVFPSWLNASNSLMIIPLETLYSTRSQFNVAVIAPYDTEVIVQPPAGSLIANGLYVEDLPSLKLHTTTKRPLPQIGIEPTASAFEYTVQVSFSEAMRGMDSLSLLSVRSDGTHVTVVLNSHTPFQTLFTINFAETGTIWVYVKGGAATSIYGQPCLGSQTFDIVVVEPRFSFVSTLDEEEVVYANEVCGRLQAPSLVTELHSDEIHTRKCSLTKFVVGSVGSQTVVDMCLSVDEEGEFGLWINEGVVALLNGTVNNPWSIDLKWIQGAYMIID